MTGDFGGDRLGIRADAADEVGIALAQEAEAERVEAGHAGDAALMRELAIGASAALIFVDYERSPEARYPVAIEQGYAVAKHVSDNAEKLMIDGSRIVVAGDSVGGNMAAVIALLAKERKGPALKAQVLFYPVTDTGILKSFE